MNKVCNAIGVLIVGTFVGAMTIAVLGASILAAKGIGSAVIREFSK